jgi:hypothetical protein
MRIDGRCHCGAVAYEAEVDPANVIICHCPDCQAMSGGPYRVNVPVLTENLTLRGELTSYVKQGASGDDVRTTFCPTCGTPLYSCKGEAPAFVWLRTGSVAQRAELPPKRQGFCHAALPWANDISDIPRITPRPPD